MSGLRASALWLWRGPLASLAYVQEDLGEVMLCLDFCNACAMYVC
jgi:hypothetical protein